MRYLLTLNNRRILQTWECATDQDFVDAITIYFTLAVHGGRIRQYSDGAAEWLGWEVGAPYNPDSPSAGHRIVWGGRSGSIYVKSPFEGTLRWGPEGSWNHRAIKDKRR